MYYHQIEFLSDRSEIDTPKSVMHVEGVYYLFSQNI